MEVTATTNGHAELLGSGADLIHRGLPIIPCNGKTPCDDNGRPLDDWQVLPTTYERLQTGLRGATAPAIGLKLGDYIDIEADGPEEEALFAKLFDGCDPPITPTYKSTRGKHRIFRGDERFRGTKRAVIHFKNGGPAKLGVRIGADGKAAQSVIPPSAGREWLVSWDEVEPATLPDIVVDRVLAMLQPKAPTPPPKKECAQNGPINSTVERARKYLAKVPPAVDGNGGHDQTFHVACVLVLGFDLEREPALELIEEWNQTCLPPWEDWELEHKIDSAGEQPGERGYLLNSTQSATSVKPSTRSRHTTDVGNAERFAEQHGADVRYCHPWGKWLVWDGRRWTIDNSGEVIRRAKLSRDVATASAARDKALASLELPRRGDQNYWAELKAGGVNG